MNTNKKFRNCIAFSIILLTLLTCFSSSALAETLGGDAVDLLIPKYDDFLEGVSAAIPKDSYSVSDDFILGKEGSIYLDYDDGEVRMIGKTSYHTYSFKEVDTEFASFIGIVLYGIDSVDALAYGVKDYFISDNDVTLLTEDVISTLAAQFVSSLNLD